jgi:hypothetical protein
MFMNVHNIRSIVWRTSNDTYAPIHVCIYVYEQWNIQETNVALRGLKLAAASSAGKNDRQTM